MHFLPDLQRSCACAFYLICIEFVKHLVYCASVLVADYQPRCASAYVSLYDIIRDPRASVRAPSVGRDAHVAHDEQIM